jgi:putative toxin-antitoxin system antitoxin component (TIGR02293 family)
MKKSDRMLRETIIEKAIDTFGDSEKAQLWMMLPNRRMHGRRPDELLDSAAGRKRVKSVLGGLDQKSFG